LYNFIFFYYFYFLILPLKLFEFTSLNLIDFSFRNDPNEYFFNFYSTFWTTLWYFLIYLLLLSLALVVNSQLRTNYYLLIVFFVFVLLGGYELISFCYTNTNFNMFNNFVIIINFLLINTLNKYHPLLFYLSISSFFYFYMNLFYKNNFNYFYKNHSTNYLIRTMSSLLIITTVSLVLGSWWAFQEGSWGGWWNWDPSESFGLFLLIIVNINVHLYSNFKNNFLIKNLFILFILTYALVYCLLQMSYTLTSHNFGLKFFYFFNNNLFLIEIMILSVAYSLINTILHFFFFIEYLTIAPLSYIAFVFFKKKTYALIFFILSVTLILSFKLLIFFFSWNLTLFNYLNINTLLNNFIMYLLVIILVVTLKINNFYFLIFWNIIFTLNFFIFIIKFSLFAHFLMFLHLFFNIFCFYTLLSSYLYISAESTIHIFLQTNSEFLNWNYKSCSLNVYHVFDFSSNEGYNFHAASTLTNYLTKNLNLLKISYMDNFQFAKTSAPLNCCLNRVYVNSYEFYNEVILSALVSVTVFTYLIIIKKIKFNKLIN